ncbi:MAG: transposase, partial [Proteobacteria bacterium]|nr:transposase [Pseudomonadota bacterium]
MQLYRRIRPSNSDNECNWTPYRDLLHPKKVGTLPIGNGSDRVKQTNEIKYAPKLLDEISIEGKDITSDALHTQKNFARYLVDERKAHCYFCVKKNQPTLLEDIEYHFSRHRGEPDYKDNISV